MHVTKDPTFEEGPFFLLEATIAPHVGKRVVIWATDKATALNLFAFKLGLPTTYHVSTHLGDLISARHVLYLSGLQITDLHREGYLRL